MSFVNYSPGIFVLFFFWGGGGGGGMGGFLTEDKVVLLGRSNADFVFSQPFLRRNAS